MISDLLKAELQVSLGLFRRTKQANGPFKFTRPDLPQPPCRQVLQWACRGLWFGIPLYLQAAQKHIKGLRDSGFEAKETTHSSHIENLGLKQKFIFSALLLWYQLHRWQLWTKSGSRINDLLKNAQGLAEQMTDSKLSHYTTCSFLANGWTWFHTIISASQATLLNERCSENPATLAVTITMSWSEQYFTSDNFSKAGLQSLRSVVISCPCLVNCLPTQLIFLAPDPLRSMTPCPLLKDSIFTWTVSLYASSLAEPW